MEEPHSVILSTTKQSRLQDTATGFTTHQSGRGREKKRTFNIPVSPLEISDTYSGLQMSVILMNTPKIKFLGIRFLTQSVNQLSHSVMSNSLRPHGLRYTKLPVHHQHLELAQTYVHQVGDAI